MSFPSNPMDVGGVAEAAAKVECTLHDLPQQAWGVDAATGSLLGDNIAATGSSTADLADLHAALASLCGDVFDHLEIALDHLTSSSDLFDVPVMDFSGE